MPRQPEDTTPRRPPYFWWLLANMVALCFAVLSWTFCLEVFGNPEVPRNHEILRKLDRLPAIKDFRPSSVPDGKLYGPEELYRKFFGLTDDQFAGLNQAFLRNYMTNFEDPVAVTYVQGHYQVLEVRKFGGDDFLLDGFTVRARAMVKLDDFSRDVPRPVIIEFMFPTNDVKASGSFKPGDMMVLNKGPHCGVVMHLGKHLEGDEQVVRATVMPLAYGTCRMGMGAPFELSVPPRVRPTGRFPIFPPRSAVWEAR